MAGENTQDEMSENASASNETAQSEPQVGKDGQPFDASRAQRTIEQLRDELKAAKITAKEAEALRTRLKAVDEEKLSETERLASRAQEATEKLSAAEQRAADLALQMSVERAARKLNFIDEDDAYRLIDRKAVEMDDDGDPKNVEKLLTDLAKAKPHLVKAEGDDGQQATNGARSVPPTPKPAGRPSNDERAQRDLEGLRATGRYSV